VIDVLGLGSLALVTAEWLGVGWLSGVSFPQPAARAANWALRLLVGCWLVAVGQLVLAWLGIGFATIPLVLLAAGVGAAALRLVRRGTSTDCEVKHVPVSGREAGGWLLLSVVLLGALVRALVIPEAGWDAYSHWGLRAQAFTYAGTLVNAGSEHEYYPPLVPLLEAWLYVHRGAVTIDLGKTVWAVVGGAFGVCLAWHLRLSLRAAWLAPYVTAGIVLVTPALLEGFWTGQADLALTAFLSLATLASFRWLQERNRAWLMQAAIFGAAAALTKFEGLPRIGVLVLALGLEGALSRQWMAWRPALAIALAAGLAAAGWTAFELTHAIAPNGEHLGAFQPLAVGSVLMALVAVFAGVRTGGGLLVAVLGWAVSGRAILAPPLRLVTLVVVGQALATVIGFLFSATAPDVEVRTSATRLFEQFVPLALFVGAVGLSRRLHL
jgi:hypothetical protein